MLYPPAPPMLSASITHPACVDGLPVILRRGVPLNPWDGLSWVCANQRMTQTQLAAVVGLTASTCTPRPGNLPSHRIMNAAAKVLGGWETPTSGLHATLMHDLVIEGQPVWTIGEDYMSAKEGIPMALDLLGLDLEWLATASGYSLTYLRHVLTRRSSILPIKLSNILTAELAALF